MSQAANFSEQGIQILVPCHDKCLTVGGDYVEKQAKIYKFHNNE